MNKKKSRFRFGVRFLLEVAVKNASKKFSESKKVKKFKKPPFLAFSRPLLVSKQVFPRKNNFFESLGKKKSWLLKLYRFSRLTKKDQPDVTQLETPTDCTKKLNFFSQKLGFIVIWPKKSPKKKLGPKNPYFFRRFLAKVPKIPIFAKKNLKSKNFLQKKSRISVQFSFTRRPPRFHMKWNFFWKNLVDFSV